MSEQNQDIEARLYAGLEAAKSGEVARARAILSKVVLEKPRSVEAWWWLGQIVEDTNQRIYCFKKVLNLDPSHPGARAKLGLQPWDKRRNAPSSGDRSSSRAQRRILLVLTILTLLVVGLGGGYIYLDTTGTLNQILNPPTSAPPPTAAPVESSPTSAAVSLSTIPTWTPTASATPKPTKVPVTATPGVTPTAQPPTPESQPDAESAQVFDLAFGTEGIVIPAGSYFVMRFEAEPNFNLETIGSLVFHAIATDQEVTPTLEIYILDILEGGWEASGVNWGDNAILNPGQYISQDGTIVAALRNWGSEQITLQNAGFTLAAINADGAEVYYGLTRQEIRQPSAETPTSTPITLDS